jgi:type I restriction enzyme S subunit
MPNINASIVRSFEILVPPISTQRKIVTTLSAYEHLIENHNRRIKLLQEMVQRIYHEWFVDFRYPGREDAPLVQSDLAPAPEGWAVVPLHDVLAYHVGGGWGAESPTDEYVQVARVVRGTDIPRVRVLDVATCPTRYHTAANVKTRWLQAGDIVLEVSGGSKGQPVGRSLLVSKELLDELRIGAICASFCRLVRCDRDVLAPEILACRLVEAYASGEIDMYQVQSTGISNLRFSQLLQSLPVAMPSRANQAAFLELVGPMLSLAGFLGTGRRNLLMSRDLLI